MSTFKSSRGTGVDLCLSWIRATNGEIPDGAVPIGVKVFVGRFMHDGEWLPGKVVQDHKCCYAPYGADEKSCASYQVLCETCNHGLPGSPGYQWVRWSGASGKAPENSLIGGTDGGRPVYVARAIVNGESCSGKYIPELSRAYFPWGGSEHEFEDDFEVLVMCTRLQ